MAPPAAGADAPQPSAAPANGKVVDANGRVKVKSMKQADAVAAASGWLPTPVYNSCVLTDMLCLYHARRLQAAISSCPRLVDGIVLLKAWARQKDLMQAADGFSGHALTCLMVHLAEKNKLVSVPHLQTLAWPLQSRLLDVHVA